MSFLSGVFHSIGNFFDGNNDDEERKKRQQQQQQLQKAPVANPAPENTPQSLQVQQPQTPALNLVPQKIDANTLVKAKQVQQDNTPPPAPTPTPAPQRRPSLWHQIGTGLQKKLAPAEEVGLSAGRAITGGAQAIIDTPSLAVHALNSGLEKVTHNKANINPVVNATDRATNVVNKPFNAAGSSFDTASKNIAQGQPDNADLQKLYHAGQVVANAVAVVPDALGLASSAPKLVKAVTRRSSISPEVASTFEHAAANPADEAVAAEGADEVATGIKSVNPNQAEDAAAQAAAATPPPVEPPVAATPPASTSTPVVTSTPAPVSVPNDITPPQITEPAPVVTDNTPAYQRQAEAQAQADAQRQAAEQAATQLGVDPAPLDRPSFLHKQDMQDLIDEGDAQFEDFIHTHPDATPAQIEAAQAEIKQQVASGIQKLQDARAPTAAPVEAAQAVAEGRPVAAPLDVNGNPALVSDKTVAQQAEAAGVNPNLGNVSAAPVEPPAPTVEAAPPAPNPTNIPDISRSGEQVPVAPLSHDAVVKSLGPEAKPLKGQYSTRDRVDLEDQRQRAESALANSSADDIVSMYHSVNPDTMITDSNSLAVARAALHKLYEAPQDEAAAQTASNILDAMDSVKSKSGEVLRAAQEDFDSMPIPMKVRYIINKIDSANKDVEGYQPLRSDPAKANLIDAQITAHLENSQAIADRVSSLQGAIENATSRQELRPLAKQLKDEERNLKASNGTLVKFYSDQVPGRSVGQKALVDFPKRMMLSSFTSRINDVATTATNVAHLGLQNITQGALAKVVNLVKPGTVTDTFRGGRSFVRGAIGGIKESGGEFTGHQYTGDLQKALKTGGRDARSGLQKAQGPVGRVIQAATEFATHASEGVRDQRLYQLGIQQGRKNGLRGSELKLFAEKTAAVPTPAMRRAAEELHLEVNNLNDNAVTRKLGEVSDAIGGNSAVGGVVKNQIMPFTSWLGGNIYNSIADKNVIASGLKLIKSLKQGDAEGAVRNLAKTINHAAETYALGYWMTQHGYITNQNAEGYNDAGAYVHIGNRYIPAGFLGFFAPSIILGNSAYNATHAPEGSSAVGELGKGIENIGKSINVAGALGADNTVTRAFQAGASKGGSFADGVYTGLSGVVGQAIPAIGGDINSVLNNGFGPIPAFRNPNHEAADTKVINPNSKSGQARDVGKSTIASLENRVPFLSQSLPRKADVAAADPYDRISKGDRDTAGGIQAKTDLQKAANVSAADLKAGIPDPTAKYATGDSFDNAVENRLENKKYDQALAGLQQKLTQVQKGKDVTAKQTDPIQKQIKEVKVLKSRNYDPSIRKLYSSTSVTEWRNMGDPKSANYDPKTYNLLYQYDSDLAKAGISSSTLKANENKYSVKKKKGGSGGGSGRRSNTIGSTPDLGAISFGDLAPQKITNATIPTIQMIQPGDLIKKRAISVSRA